MVSLISQEIFTESQYQQHQLGARGSDKYGNVFRYAKFGATPPAAGSLLQEPAEDTNFRSMVVYAAAAIGADEVQVTLGGTAVTANLFDEAPFWVESSTGIGQQFHVKRHTVQTSTTGVVTFTLDRPLKIALTTSSNVTVRKNPYKGTIIYPTTATGGAVGAALYTGTANYFGWIQSGGDCPMLFDTGGNTAADAGAVSPSQAVAGSVKVFATSSAVVGISREVASVDSTVGLVHLIID